MIPINNDTSQTKRNMIRDAISLASLGRWQEAVNLNREIISHNPRDIEAFNRLGKALSELGRFKESREAFSETVRISPTNVIARKNLERLARIKYEAAPPKTGPKVGPELFIEERGKSATINLKNLPASMIHLQMTPGDAVVLKISGRGVLVESPGGQYLGEIEINIGKRIANLIGGGNKYAAAVASANDQTVIIMIKETYQHPSQAGIISFPSTKQGGGGLYSYLEVPQLPIDMELEEDPEIMRTPIIDWDEDGEPNIAGPPSEDEQPYLSGRGDSEEPLLF